MQDKLGILVLHHEINDVVRNNLLSIQKFNPDALLATMSAGKPILGGYSIDATPGIKALHALNPKRSSDWLLCSWFLQRREQCEKWWVVEWDIFCRMSVRQYYDSVWGFPFVASSVRLRNREQDWHWFRHLHAVPKSLQDYAIGAVPFLYLIDDGALSSICTSHLKNPFTAGNGELRFATVANRCGFPPCGFSPPGDGIGWLPWNEVPKRKGIFHPVKHIVTIVE